MAHYVDLSYYSGLLASLLCSVMLGVSLAANQANFRARLLQGLMFFAMIYTFGAAHASAASSMEQVIFWNRVAYLGVGLMLGFLLLFTVHFSLYEEVDRFSRFWFLIFIPCGISIGSQWSYPSLTIFYENIEMVSRNGRIDFVNYHGPMFTYHLALIVVVALLSIAAVLRGYIQHRQSAQNNAYRTLLIGIFLPVAAFTLKALGVFPATFDPTPIAFSFVTPFFLIALMSDGLLSDVSVGKKYYFERSPIPAMIFSPKMKVIAANEAASLMLDRTMDQLMERDWHHLVREKGVLDGLPDDLRAMTEERHTVTLEQPSSRTYEMATVKLTPGFSEQGGFLASFYDITEMQQSVSDLTLEAQYDGLTGLLNKKHWAERVRQSVQDAVAGGYGGALLMLDLDHFKQVNDTYGHVAGDVVLQDAASTVSSSVRKADIVGRFGGEELCIWLSNTGQQQAYFRAEAIRQAIESLCINTGEREINVTASIGVFAPDKLDDITIESLIAKADDALYRAKDSGRNCSVLYY